MGNRFPNRRIQLYLALVAVGILTLAVLSVLLPRLNRYRSKGVDDIKRLHQLGLALLIYENEHAGALPDKLDDLVTSGLCKPDEIHSRIGTNTERQEDIYLGSGKNVHDLTNMNVVVVDSSSTGKNGANVLLSDGTSLFVDNGELDYVLRFGKIWSTIADRNSMPDRKPAFTSP